MTVPASHYASIIVEQRHQALWITLNRPATLNSLTPGMIGEINRALDQVADDPALRAVVLSGQGRAFCAGADLKAGWAGFGNDDPGAATQRFIRAVMALTERLERFPRPIIAAVNGLALAGGFELLLACDLVIAATEAMLGDAHANYGLLPGGGGSARLPRRIGAARAKHLMYTGQLLPATTLQQWGLINEVVPLAQLPAATEQLAATLATKSPLGLARMKQLINDGLDQPLAMALRTELLACELHGHSADRNEGLAAFNEKRTPQFTGR